MSTEDLDYTHIGVELGKDNTKDVDQNNVSIIKQHISAVEQLIMTHNTLDVIDPNHKTLTGEQQIMAHKQIVAYLRMFREDLKNKAEELSDGR